MRREALAHDRDRVGADPEVERDGRGARHDVAVGVVDDAGEVARLADHGETAVLTIAADISCVTVLEAVADHLERHWISPPCPPR
jgi:hypothetical protein